MQKIVPMTLTIAGLIVGLSTIATAAPATHMLDRVAMERATGVTHVDYYYNHHKYHNRSWDKKRRSWRYY